MTPTTKARLMENQFLQTIFQTPADVRNSKKVIPFPSHKVIDTANIMRINMESIAEAMLFGEMCRKFKFSTEKAYKWRNRNLPESQYTHFIKGYES